MNYRDFGNTGVKISEIGLGTWQLGADWGKVEEKDALAILNRAVDLGVNFLDTADVYGAGRSEKIIGEFLKSRKEEIFVATKIGRGGNPGWPANFSLENMRTHVQGNIERLGVERLNLVQLHCIPTEELKKGEVFENLRSIKQEGLIENFGVSVESMEEADICLQHEDLTSLQIIFNIFRQKPIDTLFEKAKRQKVGIIARVPLASGLLTGKMSPETKFSEDDHRNYNKDGAAFNVGETFAGIPYDKGLEAVEEIRKLAPEGLTMAQMALRWILDHDAVSTVIPGASKLSHVASNVGASDAPVLSDATHKGLKLVYEKKVIENIRGPY